ncbi:uncharacterized protein LOC133828881 [Humulus lupulus]|uniref:uncharacterized protein LOC133828881 n=1 Tax=Humulus lupulus TaxID=3486 RepID=UPI002B40DAAE|nr:uncharacterized protein LOC133828881 [Humulus lupulus]
MAVDQVFNHALNEVLSGVLTMSSGWRSSRAMAAQFEKRLSDQLCIAEAQHAKQLKTIEAKHDEQLKEVEVKHIEELQGVEAKHIEAFREVEAKHTGVLQTDEAKLASLEAELKKLEASIAKITASKEQYKEVSLMNYREAHKLQAELEISHKETADLEEANARNLEEYEGAVFECFYMFWKCNPNADFSYLPDHIREAELARCVARLEEEKTQGSPEISLATGVEGVQEDIGAAIDQQPQEPQQDLSASS